MTTVHTQAWLDQEDRRVTMTIREHGCHISYVYGCGCAGPTCPDQTPFAYSTGFFGLGHPELLLLGLDPHTSMAVINHLFARVRSGEDLTPGEFVTFADWPHRIVVESVPNPEEIALTAQRHYQKPPFDPVPLLQLTWDDRSGRFPWDAGYSVSPSVQPRPGSFRA